MRINMKGTFWVKCDYINGEFDFSNTKLVAYPVNKDTQPTPSHINVWENVREDKNTTWNYYPRGRIEIRKNKAVVFANPICFMMPDFIQLITEKFDLHDRKNDLKADNSNHYAFTLCDCKFVTIKKC